MTGQPGARQGPLCSRCGRRRCAVGSWRCGHCLRELRLVELRNPITDPRAEPDVARGTSDPRPGRWLRYWLTRPR